MIWRSGSHSPLDDRGIGVLRVLGDDRAETVQHLVDSLVELGFPGIAVQNLVVNVAQVLSQVRHAGYSFDHSPHAIDKCRLLSRAVGGWPAGMAC